jgi:hypothetical protein
MPTSLKLKTNLPFYLESRLVNQLGFYIQQRVYKECIIFTKHAKAKEDGFPLTKGKAKELERRCDNIVSFYPDPYRAVDVIRIRLQTISQGLPEAEREFILRYMEENFPQGVKK